MHFRNFYVSNSLFCFLCMEMIMCVFIDKFYRHVHMLDCNLKVNLSAKIQTWFRLISIECMEFYTSVKKTAANLFTSLKVRIHCEIFLSNYFMKHSLIRISLHLVLISWNSYKICNKETSTNCYKKK